MDETNVSFLDAGERAGKVARGEVLCCKTVSFAMAT